MEERYEDAYRVQENEIAQNVVPKFLQRTFNPTPWGIRMPEEEDLEGEDHGAQLFATNVVSMDISCKIV